MSFVHLHTHSHFSLLDGLGTIPHLVAEAKRKKMPALALTDHGVMYGAVEFYQECKKAEIKPIIGVEGYLADDAITDKNRAVKPFHLVLLAESNAGYHNLMRLTTDAHLIGFYYKPRFDWETLKRYSEGLIALTACRNGPVARPVLTGDEQTATGNLDRLLKIFGKDNLFVEIQHRPSLENNADLNRTLIKLARSHSLGIVATNDAHYIRSQDASAHEVLLCLQTKAKLSDKNRMSYLGEDFSLLSGPEMRELFSDVPRAVENTLTIAERCSVELPLNKINLPYFEVPDDKQSDEFLRELCLRGIQTRYGTPPESAAPPVIERLEYELTIIKKTGFADFFLIVQDFVNWAKNHDIMVGPGRGSAAGSLVSYLTSITNIDPLAYDLLFERFLNPDRITMPDFDIDFADTERNRVLQYVEKKYGKNHVAQIITFGTMAARAAVRDVGRVMGLAYSFCDHIAKLIPAFTTLSEALEKVAELKSAYAQDPEAAKLLDMARSLEGVARHSSTHACAVIIAKDPLREHVPLQYSTTDPDLVISQYSMHPVEDLGLLKIDFLGLTNLTVLQTSADIINKTTGDTIVFDTIPLDDPETFKLLQRGETTGIFQLESDGMTRYLKKLKPTNIEDIIAMVSLYRPGPMQFIDDYIAGKHGKRKIEYIHPKLAPILDKTYGIAVYQEQVLQIARQLAGFTYGEADILRKAVGKKIKKLLVEQSEKMINGMIAHGIEKNTARSIWEFILPFARYGFNRSHAASYAIIAYQTAYLKSHYPSQFMAALMTADVGNTDRIAKQIQDCRKMNLEVQPPDVNESFSTFAVVIDEETKRLTNKIRFGLSAVKNVGDHIAKTIIRERKENGRFTSIENFLTRIHDKDLNKKSLESLIKCGALDALGNRGQLLENLEELLNFNKKMQSERLRGQENLFADLPLASQFVKLRLIPAAPLSSLQQATYEKELLGLYISDHPFKSYVGLIPRVTKLSEIGRTISSGRVKVSGILTSIKKIVTKSGKPMLFASLEDSTGSTELIIFPKLLEQTPNLWQENQFIVTHGDISDKDGVPKILAEQAEGLNPGILADLQGREGKRFKLWLTLPSAFTKARMQQLTAVLKASPGTMQVYIVINNGRVRKIKTPLTVANTETLKSELSSLIGQNNISVENA